jgi:anti-sigma regulatory factor (Ser/Thr protein kinase)
MARYDEAMTREADPDGDPRFADAKVPNRSDSVYAARAFLVRLLDGWGVSDAVIDDAALLTSELMANAVEHGSGDVNLKLEVNDGLLHVAVHDDSEELPQPGQADPESTGGRGLWIVQSVAHNWGSDSSDEEPGKTVWFELKVSQGADD